MFSDSGTAEQTEESQQVVSEPRKGQGEAPGDSEPGPSASQSVPVTMGLLESILRYGMATGYQPVTMSRFCSTPRRAFSQNPRAQPRNYMDFQFGEPSGSFAFSQKGMSAGQTKSPASSQLMKIKDQETYLTDSQERAVPDSQETVYKECRYVKVPFGKETFVFQPTPLRGSQRNSPGDSQDTHSGGQLVPLEGGRVRSFSNEQTWDEDHEVPSVLDLTVKKKDQQMPVTGEKTFKCSQIATRVGEQFPYEAKMAAPSYSQALHPSELISSFSVHTSCQYKKMILSRDMALFRDHLVSIIGYKAFYKHQTRDLSSTQINHYGQLVSSRGQNVSTRQGTVPSVEKCHHRQETFFSRVYPPLHSGGPLAPRPPSESASVSAYVRGQLCQDNLFVETKSHDSQKTHNWKPYFCRYDDGAKSFPMSSLLRDHRGTHTGELPYACDHPQCGLKFPCLDNLLSHRREHREEQPYRCSYCNQGFTRLDDLRTHSRQHFSTLS